MNLSVVVVSAGSVAELNECLTRIVSQDFHCRREVIVVDDSVHQQLGRFVQEAYKDTVVFLAQGGNTGAAAARNRGVQNAAHDYILFVDSDCLLSGDFFHALRGAAPLLEDPKTAGLSFKVRGTQGMFSQGIKTDFLFRTHNLTALGDTIQEIEAVNTCCCLLKRVLFRQRGFREDYHYIFEDVEFSRYARTQGYRFLYYPFCTAFHRGASFKASYARKMFFSYRNRLLTILAHEERPLSFFIKTFPYELMRTVKLLLLNPLFLARALVEVLRFSRQRKPIV